MRARRLRSGTGRRQKQSVRWAGSGRMKMAHKDDLSHSFIVRIWLEETAEEAGTARWRGHITHEPGGERQYLEDLDTLHRFIAPYIGKIERQGSLWARVRGWLDRWAHARAERDRP